MSSAYVSDEFQAEIGKLPPTFLPLGNRKLVEHQIVSLRRKFPDEEIILSLPESFECALTTEKKLIEMGVTIQVVPDQFTLSEAVLYVLNTSDLIFKDKGSVSILYGDTYISDFAFMNNQQDLIAIAEAKTSYAWEYIHTNTDDSNLVWCGFFRFSKIPNLLKSLALNRDSFNNAVKHYSSNNNVSLCQTNHWHDLGHINTYFLARAQLTTQRSFNELEICDGVVRKSGEPQIKIKAEANWFNAIPAAIKKFTPLLIDAGIKEDRFSYDLEYMSCMPLNELFVHGYNKSQDWKVIFCEIQKFFQAGQQVQHLDSALIAEDFQNLIQIKTFQRLNEFAKCKEISLDEPLFYEGKELPSALMICNECINQIKSLPEKVGVLHGDLCFSNMLFDSRSVRLKVIDPRGLDSNSKLTIYGDAKYDLAKLSHSVIGLYDFIISGHYKILHAGTKEVSLYFDVDPSVKEIQDRFCKFEFLEGVSIQQIMPLVVLLFFSMLPLHSDRPDRQDAMWLNALRLYTLII